MKELYLICAGRQIIERIAAIAAGDHKVRRVHDNDNRGHKRVNIAEDADDAGPVEADRSRRSGRIERDVEDGAVEVRKCVMKNGVEVGEVDDSAGLDGEDVRRKSLVLLQHSRMLVSDRHGWRIRRSQPDYDAGIVLLPFDRGIRRLNELHLAADRCGV